MSSISHLLNEDSGLQRSDFEQAVRLILAEAKGKNLAYHNPDVGTLPSLQELKTATPVFKGQLVLALADRLRLLHENQATRGSQKKYLAEAVLKYLLRGQLALTGTEQLELLQQHPMMQEPLGQGYSDDGFPLEPVLKQVEKMTRQQELPAEVAGLLGRFMQATDSVSHNYSASPYSPERVRTVMRRMLDQVNGVVLPTLTFANDHLGRTLGAFVQGLDPAAPATLPWLQLLQLWQQVSGTQPSTKLRQAAAAVQAVIGEAALHAQARDWLAALTSMEMLYVTNIYEVGMPSYYGPTQYMWAATIPVAKGLLWLTPDHADEALLQLLADFAVRCYGKARGSGIVAGAVGNACLQVLARQGLAGVAQLARIRPKIRHTSIQELIAQLIGQAAQAQGVTQDEVEDMSIPDFGLTVGQRTHAFPDDYTATLALTAGKLALTWARADKPLKAKPTTLAAQHGDTLRELKEAQTQAQQAYNAQRERLDRSLVAPRRIPWPWFARYYFDHGLLSGLVRPLVWRLHRADGTFEDALWLHGQWQDAQDQPVPPPADDAQVQLWHPVLAVPAQVLAWRALLERHELTQPIRQAHREVYLLTPPEERTGTYSNRMAAHVLRQHLFNVLARQKGWKYHPLRIRDDNPDRAVATLALPTLDLQAELHLDGVTDHDLWDDIGLLLYVRTDYVRFARAGALVPLPEVPAQTFSEVMRDVDLFVGVASVGNDPNWRDNGGLPRYHPYWASYSFGELGELAKTRKLALERLVPRLKIGKVSEIRDRFLVVQGKRRTYKIHLGSGNILMEPNDQYLCIVPDSSAKAAAAPAVFLPFEGDAVLSIILSKALLLMNDDKITDPTITRQIGYV